MYICIKHGKLDSHWCDDCQELFHCDCSQITKARFKDLILDTEDGEKTITIYVDHCSTCGKVQHIST